MRLQIPLLRKLLWWMEERQRIYLLRKTGAPPPWTTDPILQKYHFCNVYREQDRVTVWLREHWREPYKDHPNLWFALCIARQINWPPTLEEVGFPTAWRPKLVLQRLLARRERGEQVFTRAYRIGGSTRGATELGSAAAAVVIKILDPLWHHAKKNPPPWVHLGNTLQRAHEYLSHAGYGWGPFMAYEVVTDLRHTDLLRHSSDIGSWASVGPGALRGLNRLQRIQPLWSRRPSSALLEELQAVRLWLHDRTNLPLEMRDVEHSLCEFDKYMRVFEAIQSHTHLGIRRFTPHDEKVQHHPLGRTA